VAILIICYDIFMKIIFRGSCDNQRQRGEGRFRMSDTELSDLGHKQARELGEIFKDISLEYSVVVPI